MRNFYFDESIHERGGFIVGAYVYGADPDSHITHALLKCGLRPGIDEFKSSARMAQHPQQVALREELRDVLCRNFLIGVLVMPSAERRGLGREALLGFRKIATANRLTKKGLRAFFDQGVFSSCEEAKELAMMVGAGDICEVHAEQDSREIKGLQLADLVAHTCAIMLLETLGLVSKQVKAGPDSGYDPDLELDLGFELWAGIRYLFFNGGLPERVESNEDMVVDVAHYGLHVAAACSQQLREAATQRFGECYLGCIH